MNKETALVNLGLRIQHVRKTKGLTQVQLAHAIGKDQQSIQRLEAGNINPSYFYLTQISGGLGVPVEELVKNL